MQTIALTGSPQSGKSELADQIGSMEGVEYVDVFARIVQLRAEGSEHRSVYEELMGSHLNPDGSQKLSYYKEVSRDRDLFERIREVDFERISPEIKMLLEKTAGVAARVISWVNWPLLIERGAMPDHVIYLGCEDRSAWYKKLQVRAGGRFGSDQIPEAHFDQMLQGLDCHPDQILPKLRSLVRGECLELVDTSGEDWGVERVQAAIRSKIQ